MSDEFANESTGLTAREITKICDEFAGAWQNSRRPRIEHFLKSESADLLLELLVVELRLRRSSGEMPTPDAYADRFGNNKELLRMAFQRLDSSLDPSVVSTIGRSDRNWPDVGLQIRCPHCHHHVEIAIDSTAANVTCSSCGSQFSLVGEESDTRDARELGSFSHFELIERIGIGGYGTVWKARDKQLDRTVAIKIPRRRHLSNDDIEKLLREARTAAQLNHPNIVGVHEVGRLRDTVYIVSDIIRGVTLSQWLTARRPTFAESAELCAKSADAIHHAHEEGVIHRDLKPQNILIDAEGEPHITDFGLAKRSAEEVTITIDGQVLGTPTYMSPEQAGGRSHFADARSDVYSLGVILFQLLTGETPFRGAREMVIYQVLHEPPVKPRALNRRIPRDLETICLKCLEKEPARRYQEARHLAQDLRRFLRGEPILARPIGAVTRAARWCFRNPVFAGLIGTVLASLLIGTVVPSVLALQLQHSNQEGKNALATALLANSGLLRQTREVGYGQEVHSIIGRVQELGPTVADHDAIRHEAVAVMGDFVALEPIDFDGFASDVFAIAWHPRSEFLALGLRDGTIQLMPPESDPQPVVLQASGSPMLALSFNTTGDRLYSVTAGADEEPSLLQSWERSPPGDWVQREDFVLDGAYRRAKFQSLGEWLVTWTRTSVAAWRLADNRRVGLFDQNELQLVEAAIPESGRGSISNAALSPDGQMLAVSYDHAGADKSERGFVVWDLELNQRIAREPLSLGGQYPNGIRFSADNRYLCYGTDQALLLYATPDFRQTLRWRVDSTFAVEISPDGQFLTAADIRGTVRLWTISSGTEYAKLSHSISRQTQNRWVAFSHDGQYLAESNLDGVRIWRFGGTGEKMRLPGHKSAVPTVAFHPGGTRLASGGKDNSTVVWDASRGSKLSRLSIAGDVQSVRYSPDGNLLAVAYWGGEDRDVLIYNKAGALIARATHHLGHITRLDFADDEHLVASGYGSGLGGIAIWNLSSASTVREEDPPVIIPPLTTLQGKQCRDIAASSDGELLAWTDRVEDNVRIRIWRWQEDNSEPYHLPGPSLLQGWHAIAFTPDSKGILFVDQDGRAQKWNIDQSKAELTFGDEGAFQSPHITLSKDGKWLAGLHQQDAVSIWNADTGAKRFTLRAERAAIWALSWNPQGTRLALGLNDGGVIVWDMKTVQDKLKQLNLDVEEKP